MWHAIHEKKILYHLRNKQKWGAGAGRGENQARFIVSYKKHEKGRNNISI